MGPPEAGPVACLSVCYLEPLWPVRCPHCRRDRSTCSPAEPSPRHSDSSCYCYTPGTGSVIDDEPSGFWLHFDPPAVHSPRGRYSSCGILPLRTLWRPDTSGSNRPKPQRNPLQDKILEAGPESHHPCQDDFRKPLQACRGCRSPCRGHRRCPAPQLLGQRHHLQGGRRSLCRPGRCG